MEDKVEWIPRGNGNFTSASAKNVIRRHGDIVPWYRVVWFKGNVPRQATIPWMAYCRRMLTNDKKVEKHTRRSVCAMLCFSGRPESLVF